MRRRSTSLTPALLLAALLSGCQGNSGPGTIGGTVSPSASMPTYGAVFLDQGECSSPGAQTREVSCTSAGAAAEVLARHESGRGSVTDCPVTTDFVLHVAENGPSFDEDGDGAVAQGFACMRNLKPPHPGDPGGGGGPHTRVGDCVYTVRKGEVKETACDGSGARTPQFRVASSVAKRSQCPPTTALFVQLGGTGPVGCARRV